MIPAWQLHKGSYVYFPYLEEKSKLVKVTEVIGDTVKVQSKLTTILSVPILDLRPVPLDENWLRAFKFVEKERFWVRENCAYRLEDGTVFKLYENGEKVHHTIAINVKSVHSLQDTLRHHLTL